MPIRKLKVSFEISADVFAQLLVHGNSGMNIEVYGDEGGGASAPQVPRVNHTNSKGEHPAKKQMVILEALSKGKRTLTEVKAEVGKAEFSVDISSCISVMLERGLIKRAGYATYVITKKGAGYVNVEAV